MISGIFRYVFEGLVIAVLGHYLTNQSIVLNRQTVVKILSVAAAVAVARLLLDNSEAISQQFGGMGLQTALGMQRTLRCKDKSQSGGEGSHSPAGACSDCYYGGDTEFIRDAAALINVPRPTTQVNMLARAIDGRVAANYDASASNEAIDAVIAERFARIEPFSDGSGSGSGSESTGGLLRSNVPVIMETHSSSPMQIVLPCSSKYLKAVSKNDALLHGGLFLLRFQSSLGEGASAPSQPVLLDTPVKIVYSHDGIDALVNHDGELNALKNNKDVIFRIDVSGNDNIGAVPLNAPIYIRSDKGYLMVKSDGKIQSDAAKSKATAFVLRAMKGCY